MPIYEYKCKDCGKHFESIRPMSEADKKIECVQCKGNNTHRQLSVFNARSGGQAVAGSGSSCGGCSGGHCGSCNH
jgi:putative FmdB family regulatory protein